MDCKNCRIFAVLNTPLPPKLADKKAMACHLTKASHTELKPCYAKILQSSQELSYNPNLRGNKCKGDILWFFDFFNKVV